MKAILEFDLDDFDDTKNFSICAKAREYHSCLDDISRFLHYYYKHIDLSEDAKIEVDRIKDKFYEILNNHRLEI